MLEEWAYAPYSSAAERAAGSPAFLQHYNRQRGHIGLKCASPASHAPNLCGQRTHAPSPPEQTRTASAGYVWHRTRPSSRLPASSITREASALARHYRDLEHSYMELADLGAFTVAMFTAVLGGSWLGDVLSTRISTKAAMNAAHV